MFTLDEAKGLITNILSEYPNLYPDGFQDNARNRHAKELGRKLMLHPVALSRFSNACTWLSVAQTRRTINHELGTSYGLKHRIQGLDSTNYCEDDYTTEGEFIAALVESGVPIKKQDMSVYAGLSSKCAIFGNLRWQNVPNRPYPKVTFAKEEFVDYMTLLREYSLQKKTKYLKFSQISKKTRGVSVEVGDLLRLEGEV
jgi:hypothetical protein